MHLDPVSLSGRAIGGKQGTGSALKLKLFANTKNSVSPMIELAAGFLIDFIAWTPLRATTE